MEASVCCAGRHRLQTAQLCWLCRCRCCNNRRSFRYILSLANPCWLLLCLATLSVQADLARIVYSHSLISSNATQVVVLTPLVPARSPARWGSSQPSSQYTSAATLQRPGRRTSMSQSSPSALGRHCGATGYVSTHPHRYPSLNGAITVNSRTPCHPVARAAGPESRVLVEGDSTGRLCGVPRR